MSEIFNSNLNTKLNINDGFFEIKYLNDGIYLTVFPPINNGIKAQSKDIIQKLNKKQIRGFKKELIEIVTLNAEKIPVKIAEPQEEAKIDSTASVIISPDKMRAFIKITPPENGRSLTTEELLNILKSNNVIYGINIDVLKNLEINPIYNESISVAEGLLPVNGANGKVNFYFEKKVESKPTILEDGRIDYRELNLIQSVKKDQLLCRLEPPKPGIKGINVYGAEIPVRDGKVANMPRGKNVLVSADGQDLIAGIDGQVSYSDGKVNVFNSYEVKADVDNTTGNISFVGNVIVRGNVLSGFIIDAGGNIEVWGAVEAATLKAGGDIILRRGMQGSGKGLLSSGGDIFARYIENCNVEAKNDIKSEAIMHSNIRCGNKLELLGKKGLLVGGSCRVGNEISAKVIGSYMATVTDIEVGIDPILRDRGKFLKDQIPQMESDIKKAEQAIAILRKLEQAGLLTPEKKDMLLKSLRTVAYLSNQTEDMKEELRNLEDKVKQNFGGKIRCYDTIYPGTKIVIGINYMNVKENLQYCMLYNDGSDIKLTALDR